MDGITALQNALDRLGSVCNEINTEDKCGGCPMKHSCLEEKSFMDICYDTSSGTLREFLRYGDKVLSFISEDDFTAICADQNRKADIEEQMIEEESYELQA